MNNEQSLFFHCWSSKNPLPHPPQKAPPLTAPPLPEKKKEWGKIIVGTILVLHMMFNKNWVIGRAIYYTCFFFYYYYLNLLVYKKCFTFSLTELVCFISHTDRFVRSLCRLVHSSWSVRQTALLQKTCETCHKNQPSMALITSYRATWHSTRHKETARSFPAKLRSFPGLHAHDADRAVLSAVWVDVCISSR